MRMDQAVSQLGQRAGRGSIANKCLSAGDLKRNSSNLPRAAPKSS
jgi:hypothetical protein